MTGNRGYAVNPTAGGKKMAARRTSSKRRTPRRKSTTTPARRRSTSTRRAPARRAPARRRRRANPIDTTFPGLIGAIAGAALAPLIGDTIGQKMLEKTNKDRAAESPAKAALKAGDEGSPLLANKPGLIPAAAGIALVLFNEKASKNKQVREAMKGAGFGLLGMVISDQVREMRKDKEDKSASEGEQAAAAAYSAQKRLLKQPVRQLSGPVQRRVQTRATTPAQVLASVPVSKPKGF